MNQALAGEHKIEKSASKVVYFATGTATEVAAHFVRLNLAGNGTRLRVVAPAAIAPQLARMTSLHRSEVLSYKAWKAPLLWLRLLGFLGLSRQTEVYCLISSQHFRFLKFLALTLRGRASFSPPHGTPVQLGLLDLASIMIRQKWDAREEREKKFPIGVIGSASAYHLQKIVAAVRVLYPEAPIHGLLLPTASDSCKALFDAMVVLRPGFEGALGR